MLREILPAKRKDSSLLVELEQEIFPDDWFSERTVSIELEAGGGYLLLNSVTGHEANYAGYLLYRIDGELCDITRLGIVESCRGQGLGKHLLEDAMDRIGASTSANHFMLTVYRDNLPALTLYRKVGFQTVGWISDTGNGRAAYAMMCKNRN